MKKKSILCFLLLISLISCETSIDETCLTNIQKTEQEDIGKYTIPISDVLEELEKSMPIFTDENTSPKEIKEVITIYNRNAKGENTKEPLLYAINFSNDNGYAIMAADKRIPTPLLSFVETGNTFAEEFDSQYEVYKQRREQLLHYPIYNEELQEFAIGSLKDIGPFNPNQLISAYAIQCTVNPMKANPYKLYYEWTIDEKIEEMSNSNWHQRHPYNMSCPSILSKSSVAGCVPVAIAHIILYLYHDIPELYIKGLKIDLETLENYIGNKHSSGQYGSDEEQVMAAFLVRVIGKLSQSMYFPNTIFHDRCTFTHPSNTINCFNKFGFIHSKTRKYYDKEGIDRMLKAHHPVLVAAISGCYHGHGWVIDGKIDRTAKVYFVNMLYGGSELLRTEHQQLVHCNWGWQGKCNGYYHSGVFNFKFGSVIPDRHVLFEHDRNIDYDWSFYTITYDDVNNNQPIYLTF